MDPLTRLEISYPEALHKLSSSECSSEEDECVDVLSTSPLQCPSPGAESPGPESDHSRTEEDTGHNNFSIDRILGIKGKDEKKNNLPIIPRASEFNYIFNMRRKSGHKKLKLRLIVN